jgi:hypothetical protein
VDHCSTRSKKHNSSRDKIYEKNSRIHLNRLQNKYRNCKGIKYNPSSGQNTGLQKKMVATYKQHTTKITKDNKTSDQTAKETRADH